MKTPPSNPEFERFTDAMRSLMKVSKTEISERMKAQRRKPGASASRVSGAASKRAN